MTTTIELKNWEARTGEKRVYVNVRGTRESLGYFSFSETVHARPNGPGASYYDRHRHAKGDHQVVEYSAVTWHGDEAVRDAVLDAVFGEGKVGLSATWREALAARDDWGFFRALQERCINFRYSVSGKSSRDVNTRKRARETEADNRARSLLSFEVELGNEVAHAD